MHKFESLALVAGVISQSKKYHAGHLVITHENSMMLNLGATRINVTGGDPEVYWDKHCEY